MQENTYIPLLTQVSVQLPPNIPAQCSPLKAWTQQTLHWAAESEWQDSSCLKRYTFESFWVLSQMAGACFTLLQEGGLHLGKRNYSPWCPLENGVSVPSHEVHHQQTALKSETRHISKHLQNSTTHNKSCSRSSKTECGDRSASATLEDAKQGELLLKWSRSSCYDTLAYGTSLHTVFNPGTDASRDKHKS